MKKSSSSTSTSLQIRVTEPIIFFRGSSQEAVGTILRGELVLTLAKPTKIKKIDMKFVGKSKTFWPEGIGKNKNELQDIREIVSYKWSYLELPERTNSPTTTLTTTATFSENQLTQQQQARPSLYTSSPNNTSTTHTISESTNQNTSKYQYFEAKTHVYPFSLFLPGTLPESIDVAFGKISYKLTATVVRSSTLLPNLNAQRQITIIRTVSDYEITDGGIAINRDLEEMFAYEISLPQKAYPIGGFINHLELKLTPLTKQLRLLSIRVQLVERTMYRAQGHKDCNSRVLATKRLDDFGERKFAEVEESSVEQRPRRNRSLNDDTSSIISSINSINSRDTSFASGSNSQGTRFHRWSRSYSNRSMRGRDVPQEEEEEEEEEEEDEDEYSEVYLEREYDGEEIEVGNTFFQKAFDFSIPKCTFPVHPSSNSESIKVMHVLKFFITITLPDDPYQRIEVKIDAPILLLSCRCLEKVHVTLPRCDEDSYLCPCDPTYKSKATAALAQSLNLNTTTNDRGEVVLDRGISNLSWSAGSEHQGRSCQELSRSSGQLWINDRAIQDPRECLTNRQNSHSYHYNGPPPSYEASMKSADRTLLQAIHVLPRRQGSDADDHDNPMRLIESLASQPNNILSSSPPPTYYSARVTTIGIYQYVTSNRRGISDDKPVFIDGLSSRKVTFGELKRDTKRYWFYQDFYDDDDDRFAAGLQEKLNFKRGDVFLIFSPNQYKGYQVVPAEIEGILLTHPNYVADAAVIGIWSEEESTEIPLAYIVTPQGVAQTEELKQKIIRFLDDQVAPYKKLRGGIIFVDTIPKSAAGKILRRILRERTKD
ncbi:hypothetical protein G9A89_015497 [Geosiphon pyriformis]|nr:hypothetical protein G9A89_015497 [Geosiphon pyriformis]